MAVCQDSSVKLLHEDTPISIIREELSPTYNVLSSFTLYCCSSANYNSSLTCSHHLMVRIQDFHSWHTSSILVESTTSGTYYDTDSVCRNGDNISTLVAYIRSKSDTSFDDNAQRISSDK